MDDITEINTNLYVGAAPGSALTENPKIDAILNLSTNLSIRPDMQLQAYYWHPISDLADSPPRLGVLYHLVEVISLWISLGHKVLVHCAAGISRSPTVVAAYLVRSEGLTAAQALNRVLSVRDIHPNVGLRNLLDQYEAFLHPYRDSRCTR